MLRKVFPGGQKDPHFNQRKFCSIQCVGKHRRNDPNRVTSGTLLQRARPLRKDHCETPGCISTVRISLHHIDKDETNNTPENLITLCAACHTRLHNKNGDSRKHKQGPCKICGKKPYAKGMCVNHYMQALRKKS